MNENIFSSPQFAISSVFSIAIFDSFRKIRFEPFQMGHIECRSIAGCFFSQTAVSMHCEWHFSFHVQFLSRFKNENIPFFRRACSAFPPPGSRWHRWDCGALFRPAALWNGSPFRLLCGRMRPFPLGAPCGYHDSGMPFRPSNDLAVEPVLIRSFPLPYDGQGPFIFRQLFLHLVEQVRVCAAKRSNGSPSEAFKRQNGLA